MDQGTGLGLSMVFGFLAQSGGHISVESEVGVGSTFRLYLPFAQPATPATHEIASPALARGRNETILVVEDNDGLRAVLRRQLTTAGYQVIEAGDAKSALEKLRTKAPIDLLFSDVVMPDSMDGFALTRLAVELRPKLKTLLTSGNAGIMQPGDQQPCNVPILQKPYRRDALLRIVQQTLIGAEIRTDSEAYPAGRWCRPNERHADTSQRALDRALRHVEDGEERVARQLAIVERLEGALHENAPEARALLMSLETSLRLARSTLRAIR